MTPSRLTLALDGGAVSLPAAGRIAVFGARASTDLSALPKDRTDIIQGFRPDFDTLTQARWTVTPEAQTDQRYAAAVIFVPRAKAEARALVALAASLTDGPIVLDGQKTDGIESYLKEARKRGAVGPVVTKAHGKLFAIEDGDFADWRAPDVMKTQDGHVTAPGVFSADGPDNGSVLLAKMLPVSFSGCVADLGAGWGYLSGAILTHGDVTELDIVEASHAALTCAKANISDPRARFHWADATTFEGGPHDVIVTNPPFHTSRAGDPSLGAAFIAAAGRLLKPRGQLWLVANRHLPYEKILEETFAEVRTLGHDPGFKIFHAARPRRSRR